uniref:Uncharacterized protein n=1 Tax=Anopheles christyi TaxID=43041 RepID=A0A182K7P1_9DIPT
MTSEGTLVDLDFGDTSTNLASAIVTSNGHAAATRPSPPIIPTHHETVNQPAFVSGANEQLQKQRPPLTLQPASGNGERGVNDAIISDLLLPCTSPLFDAVAAAAADKQSVNNNDQGSSRLSASSASTVATTIVDTGDGTPLVLPDVSFEGITLDSGIDRESQPLLGSRDHEITYNQFPEYVC